MTAGLAEASASGATPEPADEPRRKLDIVLTVNSAQHRLQGLDAHTTLLDVLGDDLHAPAVRRAARLAHAAPAR